MRQEVGKRRVAVVARPILRSLARIVPKARRAVIRTTPDFDDTTRVVAEECARRGLPLTVLTSSDPGPAPQWFLESGHDVVRAWSITGLWRYLRARYVMFTHSLYLSPAPAQNQVIVNLWHGMPLKRIGLMRDYVFLPHFTATVATSPSFAEVIARSFDVGDDKVWITGLPRNDILTRPVTSIPDLHSRRFVTWLPTYRVDASGAMAPDGDPRGLPNAEQVRSLAERLARHDTLLVVKLHPIAPRDDAAAFDQDGVLLIDERWLAERSVSLYELLAGSAALITDYSSVAVDFAVTGRPIVFAQADQDAYLQTRGLVFDPDAIAIHLGPIAENFDTLPDLVVGALTSGATRDPSFFYAAPQHEATRRVFDHMLALGETDSAS